MQFAHNYYRIILLHLYGTANLTEQILSLETKVEMIYDKLQQQGNLRK